MKKALIVARCSSNELRQDVKRQTEELYNRYSNQYKIVDPYEYYESGTKNDRNNDIIIEKCLKQNIDTIIVSEVSRIGRKMLSVLKFIERCNEKGINIQIDNPQLNTLIVNSQGIKEENPIAKMLLGLLSSFAEMELKQTMIRLNSGRAKYVRDGGKLGRKVGYREDIDKLLAKYPDIVKMLDKTNRKIKSYTIRDISEKSNNTSTATIMKVKKAMKAKNMID